MLFLKRKKKPPKMHPKKGGKIQKNNLKKQRKSEKQNM